MNHGEVIQTMNERRMKPEYGSRGFGSQEIHAEHALRYLRRSPFPTPADGATACRLPFRGRAFGFGLRSF